MCVGRLVVATLSIACTPTLSADAQPRAMTLAEVLARARDRAPQIVSARLAVDEARARVSGASLRVRDNPELEGAAGNRDASGARFTDFEIGISQALEPWTRRGARVSSATAAVEQATAMLEDATRDVLRVAAAAFYRTLHATARARLLDAGEELAARVYAAADRRFKAGDIAVLDVNLARASLARARAEREGAEASRVLALGALEQVLGIGGGEDIDLSGDLNLAGEIDPGVAATATDRRPDLRVLEGAVREADADLRLGESFTRPDYRLAVRYAKEEGDQILFGGIAVTLPLFSRGQELRAAAAARASRLRAALEAARVRVQTEVRAAFDAYQRRLAAVNGLAAEAIPGLDENEALTARSFEVGQIGLPELLVIRRELLDTRLQHLDAQLEAALARVELEASAGLLQ